MPGIWPRAPPGAHLECPESSFGTPRELICGRTGAHFLTIGAHVCVHGTARCAGSLRTRRSNTSQSPCSPSYFVAHTAPRSSFLGAQQLCSRHHLTELPLHASQVLLSWAPGSLRLIYSRRSRNCSADMSLGRLGSGAPPNWALMGLEQKGSLRRVLALTLRTWKTE